MIKFISCLFFFIAGTWVSAQDLSDGLIYYFPFADTIEEEQSATQIQLVGSEVLTENRFGSPACAWDLSTDPNSISFELNEPDFSSPLENFTVALWMQLDAADSAEIADYQNLLAMDDIHLALFDLNTPLIGCGSSCGLWDNEWNENYFMDYNNTDTWHQLVWSFDAGELKLYRDGVLKNIDTLSDRPTITTNSIVIGEDFYGKLDDIRIYNRVLSEGEVFDLYELEEGCAQLNCEIFDYDLSNFECLGDSSYIVTLDFGYSNTSDSFDLALRSGVFGRYAYGDVPLRVELPFSGFPDEFLSITDIENADCSLEFEFEPDCGTTSFEFNQNQKMIVWPNPFQHYILVDFPEAVSLHYELINTMGAPVIEGKIRSGERIRSGSLQNGYYILHVWGEGFSERVPLIKSE